MKTSESNPQDWFRLAADRLRVADSAREHEGITCSGIELLQEAVELYLKGYLVAQGWLLERTRDLRKLVDEADKHHSGFAKFTDQAQSLTEQYWAQHYPGNELDDVGADYDDLRRQAGELMARRYYISP